SIVPCQIHDRVGRFLRCPRPLFRLARPTQPIPETTFVVESAFPALRIIAAISAIRLTLHAFAAIALLSNYISMQRQDVVRATYLARHRSKPTQTVVRLPFC